MNKIFKVIWSKARGCYVVVSEIAKNQSKGRGKRARQLALAAIVGTGVALSTFTGVVYAEPTLDERVTAVEGRVTTIETNISGVSEATEKANNAATNATTAAGKAETAATNATTAAEAANTAAENVNSKVESAKTAATNAEASASQAANDAGQAKTAVENLEKNFNEDGKAKSAVEAEHATSADSATNDGNGKNIAENYSTKAELQAEKERAEGAEKAIEAKIGEVADGHTVMGDVAANAKAISDEVTRATGAEKEINDKIGEVADGHTVMGDVAANAKAISDEATRVNNKIGDISTPTVKDYVDNGIAGLNGTIGTLQNGEHINSGKTVAENLKALDTVLTDISYTAGTEAQGETPAVAAKTSIAHDLHVGGNLTVGDKFAVNSEAGSVKTGDIVINDEKGEISGLSNTTWKTAEAASYDGKGTAATEGQLYDLSQKGFKFNADPNSGFMQGSLASEMNIIGDGNIKTSADNKTMTIGIVPNPTFTKVSTTPVATSSGNNVSSVMDAEGFSVITKDADNKVVSTVKLTPTGLDNGGNRLSNIAAGTDDLDAVTVQQLRTAKIRLKGGSGVDVTPAIITDETDPLKDGTEYTISFHDNNTTYMAGDKSISVTDTDTASVKKISVNYDENIFIAGANGLTLKPTLSVGGKAVTIDGANGYIGNLYNTQWNPALIDTDKGELGKYSGSNIDIVSSAASVGQLYDMATEGWTIKTDNAVDGKKVSLGKSLYVNGDNNITASMGTGVTNQLNITITEKPIFDEVTSNKVYAGSVEHLTNKDFGNVTIPTEGGNITNRAAYLTALSDFANSDKAATEAQLYKVVEKLSADNSYVKSGAIVDNFIELYQYNSNVVAKIDISSLKQQVVEGIIKTNLGVAHDSGEDNNHDNWTITEYEMVDDGQGGFKRGAKLDSWENTTLAQTNSTRKVVIGDEVIEAKSFSTDKNFTANTKDYAPTTRGEKKYGQSFTIMDTAGNKVEIDDIASASVLKEIDGYVINHENRVRYLENGFGLQVGNQSGRIKAGDQVTINANTDFINKNLTISYIPSEDGKQDVLGFSIKDNPNFESVTAGSGTNKLEISSAGVKLGDISYITTNGLNAGGKTISNLANGVLAGDAVNYGQFSTVLDALDRGMLINGVRLKFLDKKGEPYNNSFSIVGDGKNITVGTSDETLTIHMDDTPNFAGITVGPKDEASNQIVINREGERAIENLAVRPWSSGSTEPVTGRAATEDQLYAVDRGLIQKGLDFVDDNGAPIHTNLGDDLHIVGGATGDTTEGNIAVTGVQGTDGGTLSIKLAQNIDLSSAGSLKTGSSMVSDAGLVVSGDTTSGGSAKSATYGLNGISVSDGTTGKNISFTTNGISAGDQQIHNVASGYKGEIYTSATEGYDDHWNNVATIGDVKTMAASVVSTDTNIVINVDTSGTQNAFTAKLNDVVTLGTGGAQTIISGTAGTITFGDDTHQGLVITGSGDSRTITNLTNTNWDQGATYNSGRAATEEQLKQAIDGISGATAGGWGLTDGQSGDAHKLQKSLGEIIAITGAKETTDTNIQTSVDKANDAIRVTLNKDVNLGATGSLTVNNTKINSNGVISGVASGLAAESNAANIKDVKDLRTTLTSASWGTDTSGNALKNIVVSEAASANGEINYVVDLSDHIKIGGEEGFEIDVNGHTGTINIGGPGGLTINKNGIDGIDGWGLIADKAADNATDESDKTIKADIGEALKITGGGDSTSNVVTKLTSDGVKIELNKDINLSAEGSLKFGTTNNALAIDGTTKKITGLASGADANGKYTVTTNAANIGDVQALVGAIVSDTTGGWGLSADSTFDGASGSTEVKQALGKTLNIKGAVVGDKRNISTRVNEEGTGIDIVLSNEVILKGSTADQIVTLDGTKGQITVGSATANRVFIDGTNAQLTVGGVTVSGTADASAITGLSNTAWKTDNHIYKADRAATEGQLAALVDGKSTNAVGGWGLSGDTGTTKADIGEAIKVAGDANIVTAATNDGVKVTLKKNVDLDTTGSVSFGSATGSTTLNASGLTISGGPSVTTNGIDAGNKIITNLGSSLDNEVGAAANINDVNALISASETSRTDYSLVANPDSTTQGSKEGYYKVANDNTITLKVKDTNHPDADVTNIVIEDVASAATLKGVTDSYIKDAAVSTNGKTLSLTKVENGQVVAATIDFNNIDTSIKSDTTYSVVKGTDGTNTVTLKQVDIDGNVIAGKDVVISGIATQTDLAGATISYRANSADAAGTKSVSLSQGLNFKDGTNTVASVDAEGIVQYSLSDTIGLSDSGSLSFGTTNPTSLTKTGLTIGTSSITETSINMGEGATVINNTGVATFGTEANQVKIDGANGTVSLGTNVTLNANGTGNIGNISFNGETATNSQQTTTITGLSNTEWENDNHVYKADRAATEGQLKQAVTAVNTALENKTFGIKAGDGNSVAPKLGQTIEIVGANDNVSTKVEDGKVKIALNNDINLGENGSISAGALTANNAGVNATVGTSSLSVDSDSTTISKGTGNDANALKVDASGTTFTHGTGDSATSTNINGSTIKADKVTIDGAAGTIGGLTNKTWDPTKDYSNSGLAATEAQLAQVVAQAGKTSSVSSANDNIKVTKTTVNNETNYEVKLGNNLKVGDATEDGSITLARKDGTSAEIGVVKKDGSTRIQYKDAEGNPETVATLNDGMKYGGDSGEALNMKLNQQVNIKGGVSDSSKLSDGNIGVVADGNNTLNIKLSKELKGLEKVEVGDTTIDNKGLTVKGDGKKTKDISIKQGNVDMGGNVVSGIAPGKVSKDSTDAVNGAQMNAVVEAINGVGEGLGAVNSRVEKLSGRVNQVGARAAALAALHPLEFDPDEKLTFSAGYGHYHGESAGAIGAYYRPEEKILLSISGTMTGKENMFNAGISFALDRNPNGNTASRPVMARQIVELNNKVEALTQQNAEMMAAINNANTRQYTQNSFTRTDGNSMLTMVRMEFTNLPEGHWGYDYLKELVNKGYLKSADATVEEGKLMTRYEFAKALYNAIVNGAPVDNSMGKGMDEFGREMDNIAKANRFRKEMAN